MQEQRALFGLNLGHQHKGSERRAQDSCMEGFLLGFEQELGISSLGGTRLDEIQQGQACYKVIG